MFCSTMQYTNIRYIRDIKNHGCTYISCLSSLIIIDSCYCLNNHKLSMAINFLVEMLKLATILESWFKYFCSLNINVVSVPCGKS